MLIGWFDSFEGAIMLVFCGAPLAFALLVGWAMWHMSRKRRRSLAEPRWEACGYLLRMLTVQRCPECGLEFDTQSGRPSSERW